jgi:uncharacterized protein with von Willebrand factor type A (vWA) domain
LDAFLSNCLLFVRLLRAAGVPVGTDQALEFVGALEWIDIESREQVFFAARCLLVRRHEHLRLFETIFNIFWRRAAHPGAPRRRMPLAPRHPRRAEPMLATLMAARARASSPEVDVADRSGAASAAELLQRKEFSQMTPEELEQIRRLMQRLRWRASLRVTRRRARHRDGEQLHMRAVLRSAARHGGVPLRLVWQRRKVKPRPLVLIADISGSMEKYARLLLQFLYGMAHSRPRVECFVFGTRLTRVTPQLRLRNIDRALDDASREVVDWAGGTRIGESLHTFNRRWARRVLGRGALVLLISDGWERGDPQLLARELRTLQGRCHRLIWLNPLLGRASYRPLVAGMRAALRYVDDFLPIHNFQSLAALELHLRALDARGVRRAHSTGGGR